MRHYHSNIMMIGLGCVCCVCFVQTCTKTQQNKQMQQIVDPFCLQARRQWKLNFLKLGDNWCSQVVQVGDSTRSLCSAAERLVGCFTWWSIIRSLTLHVLSVCVFPAPPGVLCYPFFRIASGLYSHFIYILCLPPATALWSVLLQK